MHRAQANHLRYLWRWINHYIIVEVHEVPGSWSNTLHFIAVYRALMLWLIAEWKWLERRKGLRLSNVVNTPDRWSNVCSKSQIVSAKLKRKNRQKKEKKKIHLLGEPSPVKLTGLQICSGMSSLKLLEISNALYIKTTLPIISRGTCHPKLNRLNLDQRT